MLLESCPLRDELRLFLDDQVDPVRHATLESHIDECGRCQETLDELTQDDAYNLPGRSTECMTMTRSPGAPGTDDRCPPDTSQPKLEAGTRQDGRDELGFRLVSDQTLDQQGTRLFSSAGESRDNQQATDPVEVGDRQDASRGAAGAPRSRHPQLPAYQLLDVLGEGGMGVVYKARQRGLNRFVAVKMIRGGEHARADQLARFRTEAEAVAQLHHPNIVQIFDIGEVAGSPFVSLELLEGGSLGDQIASTPQPGRRAAELLITLARAVEVAHHAAIVHRDLKPSNILFDAAGIPKITDFGLAKRLESDSGQTASGQIMGSPSYMAPEQASGHTRDVGPPADVYALGAFLYEMLTGRPPFKGETPIETVRMVIDADPVPPSQLVPRVARDLETICLKCLFKQPHKRYVTAAALAADLTRYLKGEPIEARRTPLHERAFKWSKRHTLRALVTASAAAIIPLAPLGLMLRDRAEITRLDRLSTEAFRVIEHERQAIASGRLDAAQQRLVDVRSQLKPEPKLRYLRDEADKLLTEIENRRAADRSRALAEQANARDRARFREFHANWNEALFKETAGLQVVDQRKPTEQSARAALAAFAKPGSQALWELGPLPTVLSAAEKEQIREGSYELLLVLSDVVDSSTDAGLALDAALNLRPATPAYHLRRAAWLSRAHEPSRAAAELQSGRAVEADYPAGSLSSGKRRLQANGLPRCDRALRFRIRDAARPFLGPLHRRFLQHAAQAAAARQTRIHVLPPDRGQLRLAVPLSRIPEFPGRPTGWFRSGRARRCHRHIET
jgi:serine/threonine protein kinase